MSADILEIAREIKKREKLVDYARKVVRENEINLEMAMRAEGVSWSFLEVARSHLTDKERDTLQKMYHIVQQEVNLMAEEKRRSSQDYSKADRSLKDDELNRSRTSGKSDVPLDVALKGGFTVAGDKKVRKKKKKDWI